MHYSEIIISQVLARSCGALVSFWLSKNIVFHSRVHWLYAILKFAILVILLGFISYGMIQMFITSFGMNVIVAKILAELILFIASFSIQRSIIFDT